MNSALVGYEELINFLKYPKNFANFSLDIRIKYSLIEKKRI